MNVSRARMHSLRTALLPTTLIAALVMLKIVASPLYATQLGRFPAMMIEVMGSRSILFFWSPAGYYEQLFSASRMSKQQILFGSSTFVPDAFRLRRLRPNLANVTDWKATDTPVNRYGYIGPNWTQAKPPGTRRVAVLGDSVPEGYGVNMDQGFVHLLADRLNNATASQAPGQRFEFLNFSVSGYELTQMMDVAARDVPQFHPDVYVVVLTELSTYRGWDSHLIYLVQSGVDLRYEFLRQYVKLANAQKTDDEATMSAKFAPYRMAIIRQALLTMQADAEQQGAKFLVVLLPTVEDADIAERRFAGVPQLLASSNIKFIDLSDTFTGTLNRESMRLTQTDVHPNPIGHVMICDKLYAKLRTDRDAWSELVGTAQIAEH